MNGGLIYTMKTGRTGGIVDLYNDVKKDWGNGGSIYTAKKLLSM